MENLLSRDWPISESEIQGNADTDTVIVGSEGSNQGLNTSVNVQARKQILR